MACLRELSKLSRPSTCTTKSSLSKSTAGHLSPNVFQKRSMAAVIPPVMQNSTGSKGPTAMVFMNMGGPSTTDEVGDFLSRLFVSPPKCQLSFSITTNPLHRPTAISFRLAVFSPTLAHSSPADERLKSRNNMLPSAAARPSGTGLNTRRQPCALCSTPAPQPPPHTSRTSPSGTRIR